MNRSETAPTPDKKKRTRLAFSAITAAVLALAPSPSFAQDDATKSPEQQKAESEKANRKEELKKALENFNVDDLQLGTPESLVRTICEQFGVYIKDKHIGDINSDGFKYSMEEFMQDVADLLEKKGIDFELKPKESASESADIVIQPEAQKMLDKWGGFVDTKLQIVNIGDPEAELAYDNETKSIEFASVGDDMLIIVCKNTDGSRTIVTCVDREVRDISKIEE